MSVRLTVTVDPAASVSKPAGSPTPRNSVTANRDGLVSDVIKVPSYSQCSPLQPCFHSLKNPPSVRFVVALFDIYKLIWSTIIILIVNWLLQCL